MKALVTEQMVFVQQQTLSFDPTNVVFSVRSFCRLRPFVVPREFPDYFKIVQLVGSNRCFVVLTCGVNPTAEGWSGNSGSTSKVVPILCARVQLTMTICLPRRSFFWLSGHPVPACFPYVGAKALRKDGFQTLFVAQSEAWEAVRRAGQWPPE